MRRSFRVFACLLLISCTSLPERPPVANPTETWIARKQVLAALEQWRLSGRLVVATEEDAWHVKIHWEQKKDAYTIDLMGPLGSGQVRLLGSGKGVILHTEEGIHFAHDPELLLYQHSGIRVPVFNLRYWILGISSPGAQGKEQLDAYGRLKKLTQGDWDILFKQYVFVEGIELPDKLFLNKDGLKIKLAIDSWTLSYPNAN